MSEDKRKHLLQSRGVNMKGKGLQKGDREYSADDSTRKNPQLNDRGMGSSFAMARLREEATRVKAERKIPGNLGYRTNLGTRADAAGSSMSKERRMLYKGKK